MKANCPNHDTTKVGNGSRKNGVAHRHAAGGDDSNKWCTLHKTKTHSDPEFLKQGKSAATAQTSAAVADPATTDATVGSAR